MADFRPFSPRWGDISFTEAPQTTARCYAGVIFLSYSPSGRHREPAGVEGAGVSGGPGCGARGRRRSLAAVPVGGGRARAGLEIDHSERSSRVAISRAGRRPPAHSAARPTGQEAQRPGPPAPGTPAAPHATTTRVRQRGGYRSTRPLSAHSATASSRLRPNVPQSWRRRRIHRNMPPTTAAPRPAPPIRPSKPVRARPFFGLVAGTSGAT